MAFVDGAPARVGIDLRCLRAGPDRLAGVGIHAREIARRLFRGEPALPRGGRLRYVPFGGSRWRSRAREALGLPPGAPELIASVLPGRVLEAAWRLAGAPLLEAFTGRLDLVHGPDYFLPPHRAPRRIYTVHDLAVLRHPRFSSGGFRRYFESQLPSWEREGTSFIAVSRFTRKEMESLLGVPAARVRVVPNGVGPEFAPVSPGPEGAALIESFRAAHELPRRFLLGVGSIQPRKNLANLLRAFRILRDRGRRESLVLCANQEWLSEEVRREAAPLGGAVRFLSLTRTEMPLLYAAAAAVAVPSFYEGFSLPVLEALASGVPVAASRAGAHPEVLGEAGLYFSPEDPTAIAGALECLLDDESLREKFSVEGPARAALFSWERSAALTRAAYLEALGLEEAQMSRETETYFVSR